MLPTVDNVSTMLPTDHAVTLFDCEVVKVNKESDNLFVETIKTNNNAAHNRVTLFDCKTMQVNKESDNIVVDCSLLAAHTKEDDNPIVEVLAKSE